MRVRSVGIVIGRSAFGNTSQVVSLLTPDQGVLGLLAKGVNRPRNPLFHGPFDLAGTYEFVFIPRRRGTLGIVTEAEEIAGTLGLRRSRERLADAFVVLDFVRRFAVPETGDERSFTLVSQTLRVLGEPQGGDQHGVIDQDGESGQGGLLLFLRGALVLEGVAPSLTACVICGKPRGKARRYGFSYREGGLVCSAHGSADGSLARESLDALIGAEGAAPADRARRDDAVRFLVDWANYVLASRRRMLEYPFYLRKRRRRSSTGRIGERRG